MQTITLDIETYFDKQYSLKKLATYEYIRDPRFKVHGVGVKINDRPTEWWTDDIEGKLKAIDWANTCLVGHNLYFDATILFEHYGIVPARRLDTLSMAKALLPTGESCSLDNVASLLGLGHKIAGTLKATEGVYDLDPDLLARLGTYCIQDVELTREIFLKLSPHIPPDELDLIDMTLRMATAPRLEIDLDTAIQAKEDARIAREQAIEACGYPKEILTSNKKFAALLTELGIAIPTKISPATGLPTPALGKNDTGFIELTQDYPEHEKLWVARKYAKSTIGESRAARWEYLATHGSRKLPFPLSYYAALTGRWGGMEINLQNLPRGGLLRKAIIAPKGYSIVVADSAQIELRVNAWFAGQEDILEILRTGKDLYKEFAAKHFNIPVDEVTKDQRGFAKICILACGYGQGWRKFQQLCAIGPMGMPPLRISDAEAQEVIANYRAVHHKIAAMWKTLDSVLGSMTVEGINEAFGCLRVQHERLQLPNGLWIDYSGLRITENGWMYGDKRVAYTYGAKVCENIVQALARIVVANQMLAADKLEHFHVVGMVHDEIIGIAPTEHADAVAKQLVEIMRIPPTWAEDLPLDAEAGWDRCYSK